MKKLLAATALTLAITSFQPALAGKHGHGHHHEETKDMTKEERKAHHEEKKAAWEAMSKEEKLVEIEKHRAEKKANVEEKWSAMSDDEKIAFVEEKREKRKEGRKGKRKERSGNDSE